MQGEPLRHDVAWAVAHHITEIFAAVLREEEHLDALAEIYLRVKAGLECYEAKQTSIIRKLYPGRN